MTSQDTQMPAPAPVQAVDEEAAQRREREHYAYIETLERAVLEAWWHDHVDGFDHCGVCQARGEHPAAWPFTHAPGCIVPALIAKYPDGS